MKENHKSAAELLQEWRDATRAAELAERLAQLATSSAERADRDAAGAAEIAKMAERAAGHAERAARVARRAAGRRALPRGRATDGSG